MFIIYYNNFGQFLLYTDSSEKNRYVFGNFGDGGDRLFFP